MTGADPAAFVDVSAIADVLQITPGQITKRGE
jgi:hypothetical protein